MDKKEDIEKRVLLGRKIKTIRKQKGFTQETFSEKIGIETSSLSNIENGKSFPSLLTFTKIAEILNMSYDELFDVEYLKDDEIIENEMLSMIKNQTKENKQIIYRILKSFNG